LCWKDRPAGERGIESEIIDELAFRYINFGFIMHTIMFALGCYYSSILYGTWWQWDPAESTSLITWLSVGLYIHMRLFYNWKEKRAAWLFIVIFATVIFSYWGLIYMPAGSTFHVFDLELKAH
jgi:ABC-type transport system involved in cytochrome c biogenesis permease subunit